MANWNYAVFKEPKGFIKIIQILFVIVAFASICSFSGETLIQYKNATTTENITIKFGYPFKIDVNIARLNLTVNESFSTTSEFSVFIGVLSMLYCIAALLVYIYLNDFIYQDPKIRKVDFVIESMLSFLWFIVAVAWSDAVRQLKYALDAKICSNIPSNLNPFCSISPFSGAYIGIIASFTTFALMGSGLWFLWKETSWSNRDASPGQNYETQEPAQRDPGVYY